MIQSVKKINYMGSLAHYKLEYTNGETWQVPHDEENRQYQEIQEWVAEGNTIQEAD